MEQKLYAKQDTFKKEGRKNFSRADTQTTRDWEDEAPVIEKKPKKVRKPFTAFTKFLIGAILFFLLAVAAAFLVFTSGQNNVSYDKVALSVLGPNSVPGGEALAYDVIVRNDNDVDITLTDIIVKYPKGSYEAEEDGVTLSQEIRSIDTIKRGAQSTQRFNAVFFGTEGEIKDITITFEYRVADSNQIMFKERVYQVLLESSPISVEVIAPQEALSGDDIEIELEIISNANSVIDNLSLQVEYPFGFEFQESAPSPIVGTEDTYSIGALGVGETKRIKILGSISGQDEETRVFKYRVGLAEKSQGVLLSTLQQTENIITITRPAVSLMGKINDSSRSVLVLEPYTPVKFTLEFLNNLATQIQDAQITATITGNSFSQNSIRTDGFYSSKDKEILWQKTDIPILDSFTSGSQGEVEASFRIFRSEEMAGSVINPQAEISYNFSGKTFDFENNEKQAKSKGSILIKVPTDLKLDSRVVHSIGPFENTGGIQLQADETSEYTVVWKVSNTTSEITNLQVEATLPPYVEFKQALNNPGSVIEYNEQNRKLLWTVDTVAAGAGYGEGLVETAFQIAVTPSVLQKGDRINFTQGQSMKGYDTFAQIARIYPGLRSENSGDLTTDPQYNGSADRVTDK